MLNPFSIPTFTPNFGHPLNRGLVLWLLSTPGYNGFGSSQWNDISGSNNHCTLTNMDPPTDCRGTSRPGGFGEVDFDGTDDYAIAPKPIIVGSGAASFSLWFRTSGSGQRTLLGGGSGTIGTLLQFNVENGVLWSRNFSNTATGGSGYNDGKWHYLVWAKPADSTVAGWKAYVDGKEIALTTSGTTTLSFGTSYNTSIGYAQQDPRYFPGSIDDVRILDRDYSAAEAADYYRLSLQSYHGLLNRVQPWYYGPAAAAGGVPGAYRRVLAAQHRGAA